MIANLADLVTLLIPETRALKPGQVSKGPSFTRRSSVRKSSGEEQVLLQLSLSHCLQEFTGAQLASPSEAPLSWLAVVDASLVTAEAVETDVIPCKEVNFAIDGEQFALQNARILFTNERMIVVKAASDVEVMIHTAAHEKGAPLLRCWLGVCGLNLCGGCACGQPLSERHVLARSFGARGYYIAIPLANFSRGPGLGQPAQPRKAACCAGWGCCPREVTLETNQHWRNMATLPACGCGEPTNNDLMLANHTPAHPASKRVMAVAQLPSRTVVSITVHVESGAKSTEWETTLQSRFAKAADEALVSRQPGIGTYPLAGGTANGNAEDDDDDDDSGLAPLIRRPSRTLTKEVTSTSTDDEVVPPANAPKLVLANALAGTANDDDDDFGFDLPIGEELGEETTGFDNMVIPGHDSDELEEVAGFEEPARPRPVLATSSVPGGAVAARASMFENRTFNQPQPPPVHNAPAPEPEPEMYETMVHTAPTTLMPRLSSGPPPVAEELYTDIGIVAPVVLPPPEISAPSPVPPPLPPMRRSGSTSTAQASPQPAAAAAAAAAVVKVGSKAPASRSASMSAVHMPLPAVPPANDFSAAPFFPGGAMGSRASSNLSVGPWPSPPPPPLPSSLPPSARSRTSTSSAPPVPPTMAPFSPGGRLPNRTASLGALPSVEAKNVRVSPGAKFWHPKISRAAAIAVVTRNNREGDFLIRDSSEPDAVALTMLVLGKVRHYKLTETPAGYALEGVAIYPPCRTLEDVVAALQTSGHAQLKILLGQPVKL